MKNIIVHSKCLTVRGSRFLSRLFFRNTDTPYETILVGCDAETINISGSTATLITGDGIGSGAGSDQSSVNMPKII